MKILLVLLTIFLVIVLLPPAIRADWRFAQRYREVYGVALPRYRFLDRSESPAYWRPAVDLVEPQQDAELERLRKRALCWSVATLCVPVVGACCVLFFLS